MLAITPQHIEQKDKLHVLMSVTGNNVYIDDDVTTSTKPYFIDFLDSQVSINRVYIMVSTSLICGPRQNFVWRTCSTVY